MSDETHDGLAEPCRECRAPLVPGQRYCLYCGARRPDARLEFLDVLVQDAAVPPPAPAAAATVMTVREPGVNGWLRQNTPVLAVAGLILGTLLIGLLIGHWATSDGGADASTPARAAAPQVIHVDAGGSGGTTTSAADTSTSADDTTTTSSSSAKKDKQDTTTAKAGDAKAAAPKNAVSADSLGDGEAKQKAIEKAAKNGQPISTGGSGKLPPTDNKAPGGGSTFETIG